MKTEHGEQVALAEWATLSGIEELRLLFAIPNGGHRRGSVAQALRREGVRAGVPDLLLPVARGDYHGLFIELKRPKTKLQKRGCLNRIQKKWLLALSEQGYLAVVCYGFEDAQGKIISYLSL